MKAATELAYIQGEKLSLKISQLKKVTKLLGPLHPFRKFIALNMVLVLLQMRKKHLIYFFKYNIPINNQIRGDRVRIY